MFEEIEMSLRNKVKKLTSKKPDLSLKMKGGHTTKSGHKIGMTSDQMAEYKAIIVQSIQEINTEPGLTPEQRAALIKKIGSMKDQGFYDFLKVKYHTALEISQEIYARENN